MKPQRNKIITRVPRISSVAPEASSHSSVTEGAIQMIWFSKVFGRDGIKEITVCGRVKN